MPVATPPSLPQLARSPARGRRPSRSRPLRWLPSPQELRYQSSLDLNQQTYDAIRHLPQARDLQLSARQQLVGRLESYSERQGEAFAAVLGLLEAEVVPLLRQGGLSGHAEWVSQAGVFSAVPEAVDMVLDVLSDRGFQVGSRAAGPVPHDGGDWQDTTAVQSAHTHTCRPVLPPPPQRAHTPPIPDPAGAPPTWRLPCCLAGALRARGAGGAHPL